MMVFDMAVNSGPARAVRTLQGCLGVTSDGAFGPLTGRR
jgi:lysozyme family protein